MLQLASIIASITLMLAHVLCQYRKLQPDGFWFNFLNFLGALVFTYMSYVDDRPGVVALNVFWALIAIPFLIKGIRQWTTSSRLPSR